MATKKVIVESIENYFGGGHLAAYIKGQSYNELFVESVELFFNRMKNHLYVSGQPGVGKTYTVEKIAANHKNIYLLTLKGNMSAWAFTKAIAVALYKLPKAMKLAVYIDDMNHIFKSGSDLIDIFKIAMDKTSGDRLEYNVSLGAQYKACEDIEKEAIDYFRSLNPDRTGFLVPFDNRVKFIFTMNTPLPGAQEMAKERVGSDRWIKLNNRSAIRSRVTYEDLVMDKDTHWGWMANVVWNQPQSMCVGATYDQRFEMLSWVWDNWETVSEHSLRFIEEQMWDLMQLYPKKTDYRRRWEKLKG